ncbi:MAG: D-alanine--D-alanine ligase family protein [Myxococcota bacterium]
MNRKIRVVVLFGGRSAEHEVSILSARNVVAALDRDRFEVTLVGIDRSGRWLLQQESLLLAAARDPRLAKLNEAAPPVALPAHLGGTLAIGGAPDQAVDVVFPVLHGPMGEDGTVQGLLELSGVPYVGAGVLGSAVGMDKDVMKRLLRDAGLPLVPHVTIRAVDWARDRDAVLAEAGALGFPSFVKPANLGSSVGVSRAKDVAGLAAGIDDAFRYDRKVLVEQGVPNVREIECSVLGNDDPIASIPGEIVVDHPDGFYSYTAKYIDESGATIAIPANLAPDRIAEVQRLALATFRALDCAGLARVDLFLAPDGALYVNEINTLPGFTAISMYPKLWEASGLPPTALVARLVELAIERAEARKQLVTTGLPQR